MITAKAVGQRYLSPQLAAAPGHVESPALQPAPAPDPGQQDIGCLAQERAHHLVAAPADPSVSVGFARSILAGCQAEVSPDQGGPGEPPRVLDRGTERERGQRPNAGHRHQPSAHRVGTNRRQDHSIDLLQPQNQLPAYRHERVDGATENLILRHQFSHARLKARGLHLADLQAKRLEDAPHVIVQIDPRVHELLVAPQQHTQLVGLQALDVDDAVPARLITGGTPAPYSSA
jgi:hypothetical protein